MEPARNSLIVRITNMPGSLGMSAFYSDKSAGSVSYEEIPFREKEISGLCEKISGILRDTCGSAEPKQASLPALRDAGRALFDIIFTNEIKGRIRKAGTDYLILSIDDTLMRIPWELLHDGREFLCLRFALSRNVGHQEFTGIEYRRVKTVLKALVLAPSSPRIGMTYNEGIDVINELYAGHGRVETSLQMMEVEVSFVSAHFRENDIVHFVGHVDHNGREPSMSGWVFRGGIFSTGKIRAIGKTPPFPSLIFSDTCQDGSPDKWQVKGSSAKEAYGPAAAFLESGAKHYIETFWPIPDAARLSFVKEFYRLAMAGENIGEAARLSRSKMIDRYGAASLFWATFMLYGDPAMTIFEERFVKLPEAPKPLRPLKKNVLLEMPAFEKIKIPVIILAVCAVTFAADRMFNRSRGPAKKDVITEDLGAGLKYLASLKETDALADSGSRAAEWKGFVLDAFRNMKGAWMSGAVSPARARASVTGRSGSAGLYEDIFSFETAVYMNMLVKLSIKDTAVFGLTAGRAGRADPGKVRKLFARAKIKFAGGDHASALKYAEKAYNEARMRGDYRDEAMTLGLLFAVRMELRQKKESVVCMTRNMAIFEKSGNAAGVAHARFNLALAVIYAGGIDAAKGAGIKNIQSALNIYRSIHDDEDAMQAYLMLAYSRAARGEYGRALGSLDEAFKIAVKTDNKAGQGLIYKALGDICAGRKEYEEAKVCYNAALALNRLSEGEENKLAYLDTLYRISFLDLAGHDRKKASDLHRQIVEYMQKAKGKEIGLVRRYQNIFEILGILIDQKEEISGDALKRIYMEMAVSYFKTGDSESANKCVSLALE